MRKWNICVAALCAAAAVALAGCGAGTKGGESAAAQTTEAVKESVDQAAESSARAESKKNEAGSSAETEANGTGGIVGEKKGTIAVTYVKSPLNVPSIVEKDGSIFQSVFGPLGYDVTYSDLTTGPEQTQALASGDIQFLNAVGATSVILSASNEADIRIVSMYSRSPKAFKLFAKDDSIKTPEDLKGKKVAGPKGTILHELLVAYLATAGMTEDDIEFMAMGIPDAQAALAGGSVDAALLAGPTAYNMEKDGFYVVTTGEGLTEASIVTATSQKFYDEHPELVEAFLEGQKKVLKFMEEDFDGAVAATARATELSEDAVKEMYGLYDFNMEITDKDIAAMEKTEKFMENTGMIENQVDVKALILQ